MISTRPLRVQMPEGTPAERLVSAMAPTCPGALIRHVPDLSGTPQIQREDAGAHDEELPNV